MTAPTPHTVAALDVPLADVLADLDRIHAKLMAGNLDGPHLVQVHEFLDIDPDLANRAYPPMPNARKAVAR